MLGKFGALFLSGRPSVQGLWSRTQQGSWGALGMLWPPCPGAGVNSVCHLHGKQHTMKFDKDQMKIAGLLLVSLFAFCWVRKLCARCALLFLPVPKSVYVFKREKKKQGDCINGLLGSVMTGVHKPVSSAFVLPAQLQVQVNSMKPPFQNRVQEQIMCFSVLNYYFFKSYC